MANFALMRRERFPDWVNLVLAVLLFLSPWAFGFSGEQAAAFDAWACGIVVGVLSIAAIVRFAEWEEWINLALGVWLVVSPWLLGFTALGYALWTNVILGVLIAAVAAWELWTTHHASGHVTA